MKGGEEVTTDGMSESPRRRFVLSIEVGADDQGSVLDALDDFCQQARQTYLPAAGCTGGSRFGYSWEVTEDPEITHERYFEALNAHLAEDAA